MKRIFTALAIVAIVNMAALGGLATYAKTRNWLTKDRVKRAIEALKEDDKETGAPTTMPVMEKETKPPVIAQAKHDPEQDEVARTEFDRRAREIQDGWKLLETQQLALVRDRELFEEDKTRLAAEQQQKTSGPPDSGLQKELDVLGGIKPKQAKELLIQKKEADVVVLLKAMDDRKVRKIVGECKTAEERQWIGRILEQMHDGRATQAEVLNEGT